MSALALLRWELVRSARGAGPVLAATLIALVALGLVGVGLTFLDQWTPFTPVPAGANNGFSSNTFAGLGLRPLDAAAVRTTSLVGQFRGEITLLALVALLLLFAALLAPAFVAGPLVRDRSRGALTQA